MRVMVLGAGVVGVTTAWYLARAGHEVTVLDREPAAGLETSFANGGQISVSHALPWANPAAPWKILQWLGREDAPLLFRLQADPAQWRWGLAFLRECWPGRTRHNIAQLVRLGLYSRRALQELRRETGLHYDHRERGILHVYGDAAAFAAARRPAEVMRAHGCDLRLLDADEVMALEPALRHARALIAGGSLTASDETGDAHRFTRGLAERAAAAGVRFHFGLAVERLEREGDRLVAAWARAVVPAERVASGQDARNGGRLHGEPHAAPPATPHAGRHPHTAVPGAGGHLPHPDPRAPSLRLQADAYVCALGSYSAALLAPLGIALNIYPAKGYSATLPIRDETMACAGSVTDEDHKIVYTRLGDRLRVAGTAELGGWSLDLNPVRCQALVTRALQVFPGVAQAEEAVFWTGLRPSTPSNLPYIGRSRLANLYLNTGHGTLGWTHACGSARALADIVGGRRPEVDFAFTGEAAGRWFHPAHPAIRSAPDPAARPARDPPARPAPDH